MSASLDERASPPRDGGDVRDGPALPVSTGSHTRPMVPEAVARWGLRARGRASQPTTGPRAHPTPHAAPAPLGSSAPATTRTTATHRDRGTAHALLYRAPCRTPASQPPPSPLHHRPRPHPERAAVTDASAHPRQVLPRPGRRPDPRRQRPPRAPRHRRRRRRPRRPSDPTDVRPRAQGRRIQDWEESARA